MAPPPVFPTPTTCLHKAGASERASKRARECEREGKGEGERRCGWNTYRSVERDCVRVSVCSEYDPMRVARGCPYVNIVQHTVPSSFLLDCRYRPLASQRNCSARTQPAASTNRRSSNLYLANPGTRIPTAPYERRKESNENATSANGNETF